MIELIELEIRMKMLRNLSEKIGGKFPSTTLGCSVVRISRLDDAFSGIRKLKASPVEGQQLQQKGKKIKEKKEKSKKPESLKS